MLDIEEAKIWAEIISEADSGCPYCVGELRALAEKKFPQFKWVMRGPATVDVEELE